MIPNYQTFMRPFLEVVHAAGGSEVKLRDVINQLAERFELSEEEREERLPSGKQTVLDNRIGWARTYLTKAGLLEVTRRAHFVVTDRGRKAISDPYTEIDNQYLKQFDEFIAFKEQKMGSWNLTNPVQTTLKKQHLMKFCAQPTNKSMMHWLLKFWCAHAKYLPHSLSNY